jgi:hypothetical protein
MSKWKLELKAPFLGIAPESHRNPVNDYWGTYGEPTQAQSSLSTTFDCTNPNYLSPSPKQYEVTGASTTELVKYISDYTIPYSSIYDAAYAIGKNSLFVLNESGVIATHAVPNMVDGQSVIYFVNNLYYFYNRAYSGNIGKFDLNNTYDDTWGSTVSGGLVNLLEVAPHPVTFYKSKMIFGNGRYLGVSNGSTVTPQYIDYGAGSQISDIAVTGSYLYVAVVFPASGTKKRTIIYKYNALLNDTDPIDNINIKYEVTSLHAMNGVVYVFYGAPSYIGYINGAQVVPLSSFYGAPPKFNQVSEYSGYIAFIDNYNGKVYLYGQYDRGVNNILMPYTQTSNTIVGCLASPFNGLMFSGKLATENKLYRLPYSTDLLGNYSQYSEWMSVAQIVGDSSNDSIIDDITIFTNILTKNNEVGEGNAGVTLILRYPPSNSKEFKIKGYLKSKHVFRNLNIPVDIFSIHLNWRGYSEINPCLIRKIIVNGHTRTK